MACHVGFGSKRAYEQVGHREIDVERFPVQAGGLAACEGSVDLSVSQFVNGALYLVATNTRCRSLR